MPRRHGIVVPLITLVSTSVLIYGCATGARSSPRSGAVSPSAGADSGDAVVTAGVARLRAATRPYHNLDSAVAAGYPRTVADCLVHEQHGAMGYHHVNRAYLTAALDVTRPQVLLYERRGGEYRLNGVEFIVPYGLWPRDSIPPTILGQQLKHEDNLKIWYKHVWVWTDNADGIFADFNPAVRCPENAKVYKPYEAPGAERDV